MADRRLPIPDPSWIDPTTDEPDTLFTTVTLLPRPVWILVATDAHSPPNTQPREIAVFIDESLAKLALACRDRTPGVIFELREGARRIVRRYDTRSVPATLVSQYTLSEVPIADQVPDEAKETVELLLKLTTKQQDLLRSQGWGPPVAILEFVRPTRLANAIAQTVSNALASAPSGRRE